MAMGEEVGDAYISIHADTKALRAELAALKKQYNKDFTNLSNITERLNKKLVQLERETKANAAAMGSLGGKTKETTKAMKANSTAINNATKSNMRMKDKVKALRLELTKMSRSARAIGDNDFADKMDTRLKKLNDTVRDYEVEMVGVAKGSDRWNEKTKELNRSIGSLTGATTRQRGELEKNVQAWKDQEEQHKKNVQQTKEFEAATRKMNALHAQALRENKEFDASMRRLEQSTRRTTDHTSRFGRTLDKTSKKTSFFSKRLKGLQGSFRRMDSTVRIVVALVAVAGNLVAALSSGVSAGLVAVASAAVLAAAALSPLVGVLAPLALGFVAAIAGLKDLKKYAPQAATALAGLKKEFTGVAVPALMKEWGDSLARFFATLKGFLSADLFAGIGKAFAAITDAINNVLSSGVGKKFAEAIAGPLTQALSTLGQALGPLLSTVLQFLTAAAPFAVILADQFLLWAQNLEKAFGENVASGKFQSFMELAITALDSVLGLIGAVGDALGTVFLAGAPAGIELLDRITGMVDAFNDWANTVEGQTALQEWFDSGLKIMDALFDLIGDLGLALADLVTPEVIDDLVEFLGGVGDILPVLGDIIGIVGKAHILDIFTEALKLIGQAVEPLIVPLGDFLALLSQELMRVLEELSPHFAEIGRAIGDFFVALTPLIPVIADLAIIFIQQLAPILPELSELFIELIPMFEDIAKLVRDLSPLFKFWAGYIEFTITILIGLVDAFIDIVLWISNVNLKMALMRQKFFDFVMNNPIVKFFKDLRQTALDALNYINDRFIAISLAISRAFKTAFNAIANAWNSTVGKLSWTVPSWIPGIGGNTIKAPKMPTYAAGTIAFKPTIGQFGEAGPEALVPLNRPLSQVDPSVRGLSAIAQGLAPAGMSISEGAIVINTPSTNGRVIAESVLDRIVAYSR